MQQLADPGRLGPDEANGADFDNSRRVFDILVLWRWAPSCGSVRVLTVRPWMASRTCLPALGLGRGGTPDAFGIASHACSAAGFGGIILVVTALYARLTDQG